MEFKGTKGNWELHKSNSILVNGDMIACAYGFIKNGKYVYTKEAKANAKLISKAPEMLDMLKSLMLSFEQMGMEKPIGIEQLIIEATTI